MIQAAVVQSCLMAWEWISSAITGVVGLASIGAAVAMAAIGRRQAEALARVSARSALVLAREERLAVALADATEVMIKHSIEVAILARKLVRDEQDLVDIESNTVARWVARVSVLASPNLGAIYRNWQLACTGTLSSAKFKNNAPEEIEQAIQHILLLQAQFTKLAHASINEDHFSGAQ